MKRISTLILILAALPSVAQWTANGNAVGTGSNNQWKCEVAPGAVGDVYITWSDAVVSTTDYNIHVSRIRANGSVAWTMVACNAAGNQETPQVVPDGAGGIYLAWHDERGGASNYAVYAHRYDSSGTPLWSANGIQVTNNISSVMTKPRIARNGVSGVFVVFENQTDIFAQSIDALGTAVWGTGGINLTAGIASTTQDDVQLATDGNAGIVVTWDYAGNVNAQRIDAAGTELWGTAGVGITVCNATGTQDIPQIVGDGTGGAIIAWEDNRVSTSATAIYAMRILSSGTPDPAWTANGVMVGESGFDCRMRAPNVDGHNNQHIVPEGGGTFYIVYETYLASATDYDIRGRRISATNGSTLQTFAISTGSSDATEVRAVSDGSGRMIATWELQDSVNSTIQHIRTLTINSSGVITNNLYVCDGNAVGGGDRGLPVVCVSGCYAFYGWHDSRGTGTWDLYALSSVALNAPIGAGPAAPSPITGPTMICGGSPSVTYTCVSVPGATSYTWTVPTGWTISSGQGTNSITVVPNSFGGTVTVFASNACGSSPVVSTSVITVVPVLSLTNTPATCQSCCDGDATVTPSGGSPPYTYTWSTTPSQVTQTATGLCVGCYTVTVMDNNGCITSDTTCVSFSIGYEENEPGMLNVYPNPSDGNLTISSKEPGVVSVTDPIGKLIFNSGFHIPNSELELRLSPGIYFVRLETSIGIQTKKIVIR